MKKVKNLLISLFCVMMFFSLPNYSNAQEWSKEQKEVWEVVNKTREFWANRNLEGYMSNLHKDFTGWYQTNPLPTNKSQLRDFESFNLEKKKIHRWRSDPLSITISGNAAVIFAYNTSITENEGVTKVVNSRSSYFCVKENGKWLILAIRNRVID